MCVVATTDTRERHGVLRKRANTRGRSVVCLEAVLLQECGCRAITRPMVTVISCKEGPTRAGLEAYAHALRSLFLLAGLSPAPHFFYL